MLGLKLDKKAREFIIVDKEKEKTKVKLTLFELQGIVMDLSERVAKLERHHAKF